MTILCYNTVITCLDQNFKKGAAEVARGILDRIRALYAAGNIRARPDTVTYGTSMYA